MKLNLPVLLLAVIFSASTLHAQNSDHPFKFGFGTHFIDYNIEAESYFKDLTDTGDVLSGWGAGRYLFGASFNKSFSLTADISGASINIARPGNPANTLLFIDGGVNLEYHIANGYLLKEQCWFAPYISGGVGINYLEPVHADMTSVFPEGKLGIGFDVWVNPMFGFNFQSDYTRQFDDKGRDYAHHAIGMVIRFGKGSDADDDGIADWEDNCPNTSGIAKFQGCPDIDYDDIPDAIDQCPSQPGLAQFNGCPDSDNDGLADKDDDCPTEKGLMQFKGCPDSDGDGIADKDDRCPKDKGIKELKGCPDTDNDGIADLDDACKNEKGPVKFNGCPDSDNDGIQDKDDRCPKDRGDEALKGCPDNDGDGIADIDDKCPREAGIKATGGCPAIEETEKQAIIEKINFAAKSIQFESGKDIIKASSFTTLDNIVSIMKLYPYTNWSIEGHTDNQGDDKSNQELSDKRASAVKKYFVDKGIDATRLSSVGYGETTPIADNKTSTGRATNRRVEIKLVEKK